MEAMNWGFPELAMDLSAGSGSAWLAIVLTVQRLIIVGGFFDMARSWYLGARAAATSEAATILRLLCWLFVLVSVTGYGVGVFVLLGPIWATVAYWTKLVLNTLLIVVMVRSAVWLRAYGPSRLIAEIAVGVKLFRAVKDLHAVANDAEKSHLIDEAVEEVSRIKKRMEE